MCPCIEIAKRVSLATFAIDVFLFVSNPFIVVFKVFVAKS